LGFFVSPGLPAYPVFQNNNNSPQTAHPYFVPYPAQPGMPYPTQSPGMSYPVYGIPQMNQNPGFQQMNQNPGFQQQMNQNTGYPQQMNQSSPSTNTQTNSQNNNNGQSLSQSTGSTNRGFFSKLSQTFFVSKQRVLETMGQSEGSIDQYTKDKVEILNNISAQYDNLYQLCTGLTSDFKALSESQKLIGEHFNVVGLKEEEILIDPLTQLGNAHKSIDKMNAELFEGLQRLLNNIGTYRSAVIADTMLNMERYTKARLEYDGACLRLNSISSESKPKPERIEDAKLICTESKKINGSIS